MNIKEGCKNNKMNLFSKYWNNSKKGDKKENRIIEDFCAVSLMDS